MLPVTRLEEITRILEKNGNVDIDTLSNVFKVSGKTIRQDLAKLETMGFVTRVHGGAVLKQSENGNIFPIRLRKQQSLTEKERIGLAALKYIEENDIVILDGGSTTLQLAKLLGEPKIIVITNDLLIANELSNKENITLYITGGQLRREGVFTLLGRDAEKMLAKYHANKLFLGTSALDFEQGLTVLSAEEAEVKKAMLHSAKMIYCLADYSKFHKLAFASFAALSDLDLLITDSRITEADRSFLEKEGVQLEVV
ncbi:MAG TPA: DeoR/GlpR family DNA-binding transcription regulator [Bacillota bacterium]|nr:DeoR/GlpR family DNA-binding transcription regulator [Bacillota bacterium]